MKPRRLLPGGTHFVTRRTFEGIFRCVPLEEIKEILLFCMIHAANKFDIEIHGFCFMSNHYHLIVTDPHQNLSDFMRWMNQNSSRCINHYLGRRGPIWAPEPFSSQELHYDEDILDKLVYTICNPTQAQSVAHPSEWIGNISLPEHFRNDYEFQAQRPKSFKEEGGTIPKTTSLKLTIPSIFESSEEFISELETKIKIRCEEIADELKLEEKSFEGIENICLDPNYRPENPYIDSEIDPRIACKDKERRKELLEGMIQFWKDHEESRQRVLKGVKDVRFPYGTNWWCRYGGMKCTKKPPGLA